MACGILVPQPGIEPVPSAVEMRSPKTGPPGKSLAIVPILKKSHPGRGAKEGKGAGKLYIHTCIGIGDRHWLGIVGRWVHSLPIWACHEPRVRPRRGCWRCGVVTVDGHRLFIGWGRGRHRGGPSGRLVGSWNRHFT